MGSDHGTPPHDGYVYVLSAGPYVKVGRTKDPDRRIKTLSIKLPFAVEVEAIIPCENHAAAERHLHRFMRRHRVNGEWFDISDDPHLLPFLKDIAWMSHETYDPNGEFCGTYEREDLAEVFAEDLA